MSVNPINDTISLNVTNNTNLPQKVNMLGGAQDPLGIPPYLMYQWNLSNESYYGTTTASIVISNTSNPTPITYNIPINGYNINAVAFALNSLNMGFFQASGNILYVSNDYYVYGALTILSTAFTSTWETINVSAGSSASNQIQLPLYIGGNYNFTIYWGDGTSDKITSWNQAETLHTYAVAGRYKIGIVGVISEWSFGNATVSDNNKLLSISSWGSLQFGTVADLNFYQCANLDLSSVTDTPDLSATISLDACFTQCTSLTTINRSNEWVTTNIQNFSGLFADCPSFDSDISNWNVVNGKYLGAMFKNTINFNQNIGSWIVTNAIDMFEMFYGATSFNQNIGSWIISNVTNMTGFMTGKTDLDYSASNLDAIYNGWSTIFVQSNLTVDFGTIKYTLAGQAGKNILTGLPDNWTINDGGI